MTHGGCLRGEGPDRAALEAQTRELGIADAVAMPGFEANPFRFMARARLFVLSSRREGSPNVLVQALACGCPVVATDCPSGPREILALAGCGRLVGVGEVEALAEAMLAALDEPRPATLDLGEFHYLTSAARYLAAAGA